MTAANERAGEEELFRFLPRCELDTLIRLLNDDGYRVVGPTISQGAIVYDEILSQSDLPIGWTDEQEPGKYRLVQREDDHCFGYVVGPHSWKRYLFPAHALVATADRVESGWDMRTPDPDPVRYAFLGVRACEIAAIRIQDRVFLDGPFIDPIYQQRRESCLIIAVNCTQAAPTCFCTSMNTGPRCESGFDLALTETDEGFLLEIGSDAGKVIASRLPITAATSAQCDEGAVRRQSAVDQMVRSMDTDGIRDLLLNNLRHPQWEDIAARCLSCTNCTMVCPTCFCSSVKDVPDLSGNHVERHRSWDSCFNPEFSHLNGNPVRNSIASRYRQWMTHKLASWHDQFGTSGCVGCGRCITWCPPGIDITQEVAIIRDSVQRAESVRLSGSSDTIVIDRATAGGEESA